ncbi:hypothetical protein N0V90_008343 [Kalmusia sp. IMI 367209]|nr:hypothetical protein N0V90_008343 [Kalmusia sp. IMI 367209]
MGISLVVVEGPGHRLQDDIGPAGHLREAFIPMDMATDAGFVDRLVDAIKTYSVLRQVHGLHTIDEIYLIQVAKACAILGLPSTSPGCYARALDKFTTRMLEPDTHGSFRVFGVEDLRGRLDGQDMSLLYPMVVRPCIGWSSQCVTKVHNEDELFTAVQKASARHATPNSFEWYEPRTDVVVEPYIDGPEVDANFVLLDGELLFCEISDDFPSPADLFAFQQQDNFLETVQIIPSNLPVDEQTLLKESIYQSITRQGFTTGVFHCEARVQGSSMQYTVEDGLLDLRCQSSVTVTGHPKTFLHEINPRPPAYQSSMAILSAYGVDYYALQLASCIDDKIRFRAFAKPFCPSPQHIVAVKYLHEPMAGVMATEDAGADLLRRKPILKPNIPMYKTIKKKGDQLKGPSGAVVLSFLAYFLIVSKESRKSCLELIQCVEEEFRFSLQ